MSDETTTEQLVEIEGQAEPVQVREGRWRTRSGLVRDVTAMPTNHEDFAAAYPWWDGVSTWRNDGRWLAGGSTMDLLEYLGPIEEEPQPEPQPEPQQADTPATEYTPPEGWRVVRFGEQLLPGDVWVNEDGTERRSAILHWDAAAVSGGRCIRRIKPEAQPEAEPVQVREGRWRTRGGTVRNVTPTPECDNRHDRFPWRDTAYDQTWAPNGRHQFDGEASPLDLIRYLGPIEQQLQPQPQPSPQPEPQPESDTELQAQVAFLKGREVTLGTRLQQEREVTTRLRGELESVQNLLGESRQRVTQLEELVSSLRTINRGCENAVRDAGKENTALRNQLAAVKAELANVAADRQQLRVELDAAQQVPADSPELRQLRADLAEVTQDRDTYRHAHELLLHDVNATHQRTKVMTIEAIVEWLVPIRTCGSQALATAVISNLPHIMRSLTGLEDEEIE